MYTHLRPPLLNLPPEFHPSGSLQSQSHLRRQWTGSDRRFGVVDASLSSASSERKRGPYLNEEAVHNQFNEETWKNKVI